MEPGYALIESGSECETATLTLNPTNGRYNGEVNFDWRNRACFTNGGRVSWFNTHSDASIMTNAGNGDNVICRKIGNSVNNHAKTKTWNIPL